MALRRVPSSSMKSVGGPLEKDIQHGILAYLKMRGHFAFRVNTMGVAKWGKNREFAGFRPSPMKGVADILGVVGPRYGNLKSGIMGGTFFAVEVKRKGGKTSPEQDQFLAEVRRCHGIAVVAHSLDEVISAGL